MNIQMEKDGLQQIKHFIQILINFQKFQPNIYIGGSISLMLQNYIPYRIPKDIDIISKERIHIYDIFEIKKEKHQRIRQYKWNNLKFELFINPNAEYIEYKTEYGILKLSPIEEILEWKRRFLDKNKNSKSKGIKKHQKDLVR